MEAKINRSHIGKQLLTTIGINHLETRIFDGFYVEGPHALEYGAILHDNTDDYRLYFSFDGVGIDIVAEHIHIVLTTTNDGTPFHQYLWMFIGQSAVRQSFALETVAEADRIRVSRRMLQQNHQSISTFRRHIDKIIAND